MGMGNDILLQILSCLLPKTLTRFKCVSKWWCALISSPEFVVKHVQHNSDPDNNILSSSSTCTVLLRRLLVDDLVCESRPHTEPRKHIIHRIEDQDTKSIHADSYITSGVTNLLGAINWIHDDPNITLRLPIPWR
ncbi:hypothetical protein ACE6H2_010056 [Prunus campanulata]